MFEPADHNSEGGRLSHRLQQLAALPYEECAIVETVRQERGHLPPSDLEPFLRRARESVETLDAQLIEGWEADGFDRAQGPGYEAGLLAWAKASAKLRALVELQDENGSAGLILRDLEQRLPEILAKQEPGAAPYSDTEPDEGETARDAKHRELLRKGAPWTEDKIVLIWGFWKAEGGSYPGAHDRLCDRCDELGIPPPFEDHTSLRKSFHNMKRRKIENGTWKDPGA